MKKEPAKMDTASSSVIGPTALVILDGWGLRDVTTGNAVALAKTPNWHRFLDTYPHTQLTACGPAVGLPEGQVGNSEVGHVNIGAGRIVQQSLPRIDDALADDSLISSTALSTFIEKTKKGSGRCHLMGLVSDGGVHSHQNHLIALANALSAAGITVLIHGWTDGRDTAPKGATDFVSLVQAKLNPGARFATLCGRFWALDRDSRWKRIKKAYELIIQGEGQEFDTPAQAIKHNHRNGISDEFIEPAFIGEYSGFEKGDAFLCTNFRTDRVREILGSLVRPDFDFFDRQHDPKDISACLGMVSYSDILDEYMNSLFMPLNIDKGLGQVVSEAGLKQLRAAETEKHPHVTFFFNGGRDEPWAGQNSILVNSPKVRTYDMKPEMSAAEVTQKCIAELNRDDYGLLILNFANPDMVGHTGDLVAAIKACETVDTCLNQIVEAVLNLGGRLLVTADHGNCDMMVDPETGGVHTAHTLEPVPLILIDPNGPERTLKSDGVLADIAPCLLELMALEQPAKMTGSSLLVTHD